MNDARHVANLIRRRLGEVASQVQRNPALVCVATDNHGDQVAMWYDADGVSREYNVSDAQRRLSGLVEKYGVEILRTRRSGQIDPINFGVFGLS